MNSSALVAVGLLALLGLVAGMVQRAAHLNTRQHRPVEAAGPSGWAVLDAEIVIDPMTGEALEALTAQERALGHIDHGAESFAVQPDIFDEYHARHRDERARQLWNDGFDWYIAHLNEQFDALVADLPTTGEDPFDPAYWPPVSAVPTSGLPGLAGPPITLERLGAFSPDAVIEIITERNAAPTVFSWTTREYAMIGGRGAVQVAQSGPTTYVRERGPRHRRRH
jgi:hypothetical protein